MKIKHYYKCHNGHRLGQTEPRSSRNLRQFKLTEGKNGLTAFLPLGLKLGGGNNDRKMSKGENIDKGYLTTKQANYIIIKTGTAKTK